MLQLDPMIPVVTPKGKAWAFLVVDRSQEHDLEWSCFIDDTGECWTFRNHDIRVEKNITMGRPNKPSTIRSAHDKEEND